MAEELKDKAVSERIDPHFSILKAVEQAKGNLNDILQPTNKQKYYS